MKNYFRLIKARNMILLTIAGMINAFGITLFLLPAGIYDSGISGTAIFISFLFGKKWLLSFSLIVLNIPLFLFGRKMQGQAFTFYSIYVVIIYSAASFLIIQGMFGGHILESPFAGNDMILCALFGGLISGIGSGLAIRNGGTLDGIEVLAIVFAKRIGITVGTFVMLYNLLLYVIAGVVIGEWGAALYSIVAYAVALKAVDFIVEGFDHEKQAMIVTEKADKISKALTTRFGTGCTIVGAVGGYSSRQKKVIYFIVNRFQVSHMIGIVQSIDSKAYIAISEVADIYSSIEDSSDLAEPKQQ